MSPKSIAILLPAALAIAGCNEVVSNPEPISPLYQTIYGYDKLSETQQDSVLKADSLELDIMFEFLGQKYVWEKPEKPASQRREDYERYDSLEALPTIGQLMRRWCKSPAVTVFTPAVDSVYGGSLQVVEDQLGLILENAGNEGLEIPERHYAAVVWGNHRSIVLTDSVVFIALNHFLGSEYPGYKAMHQYQRTDKTPEQLPYALAEALVASKYPYELTESSTALSRMMYEGALTYIKLKIVPNATLGAALGYTREQLEWLDQHYNQMWETLIGKDIIYSTSRDLADRLVGPAPNTSVISPEYPGRAGRYMGYRLIVNYMENNSKMSLDHLLSPKFYNNPSELVLAQ